MSPDEVKAVLKSKTLRDRNEWSETLSYRDPETGKMQPVANGRFVNVIAASNSAASAADGNYETDGESFEVMFTPVPGHERAMAIVHTVGYSTSNAVHETALESGLAEKYGGLAAGGSLPQSATWLYRSGGTVTIGDSCGRRDVLGGLGALEVSSARENIALKRSASELRVRGSALRDRNRHRGSSHRQRRRVARRPHGQPLHGDRLQPRARGRGRLARGGNSARGGTPSWPRGSRARQGFARPRSLSLDLAVVVNSTRAG